MIAPLAPARRRARPRACGSRCCSPWSRRASSSSARTETLVVAQLAFDGARRGGRRRRRASAACTRCYRTRQRARTRGSATARRTIGASTASRCASRCATSLLKSTSIPPRMRCCAGCSCPIGLADDEADAAARCHPRLARPRFAQATRTAPRNPSTGPQASPTDPPTPPSRPSRNSSSCSECAPKSTAASRRSITVYSRQPGVNRAARQRARCCSRSRGSRAEVVDDYIARREQRSRDGQPLPAPAAGRAHSPRPTRW